MENVRELRAIPSCWLKKALQVEEKHGKFVIIQNVENESLITRGPLMMDNGAIYVGQWSDSELREGLGSQYWENGSFFTGYWHNDMAHGKGRLVHAEGSMYQGQW